jgi:hypothetical protein
MLYEPGDAQLHSTFLVCKKALNLCQDEEDRKILLQRVRYEFRHAILSNNKKEAKLFGLLEAELGEHDWQFYFFSVLSQIPFPWYWVRRKYQQIVYG